jgi:hypothetical protein
VVDVEEKDGARAEGGKGTAAIAIQCGSVLCYTYKTYVSGVFSSLAPRHRSGSSLEVELR